MPSDSFRPRVRELACQADRFRLPADAHYLNCAYMGPLLKVAEEAGAEAMRRKCFPARIEPEDFFALPDHTRKLFARLIGASQPQRVAVLPSVSYGIATAAANLEPSPKQNIVVIAGQFPSNMLTWRRVSRETGAELRVVESPPAPRGEILNQRILEAIVPDTAVVVIGTVHWTDGTSYDLTAIASRAREIGAALVLDATQSVGAAPFDVESIRPDAVICAAYKWLLGPYSVALGWFGPRFDGGRPLEETWMAREGSEDFANQVNYRDEYRPFAARYDVGERSNFILLPMLNAALGQILAWSVEGIADYCERLSAPLIDEATALGFRVEEPQWRSPHLFGLFSESQDIMDRLQDELKQRRIHVARRGKAVRVAPHLYNDASDMEALSSALGAACRDDR